MSFSQDVIFIIQQIPKGRVATYGQIAKMAMKPKGARIVSYILHSSSVKYKLPWHRVVNAQGKISFIKDSENYIKQLTLLKREKVKFNNLVQIDLKKFGWKG